jgi:hypothetical protein
VTFGAITAMSPIEIILILLPVALGIAALTWWQHSRANEIVRQWARSNGVELLSAQKRYLRTGPFLLYARGQFVFRVVVREQGGTERSGWLRVGGWLAGVLSNKAEMVWDS